MFTGRTAVVTGGAHGIGQCIAEEFRRRGARVCVIDLNECRFPAASYAADADGGAATGADVPAGTASAAGAADADGVAVGPAFPDIAFVGDVADKAALEKFASMVIARFGQVDFLVNNALPPMKGIDECSYEEFRYALDVGVTAPFYLSKLFSAHFAPCASIINISSTRDSMSQPQTECYSAAKGGIAALTHALAMSFAGRVRVNSISPGWIDTAFREYAGPDALQHPSGRVGNPLDIANMVMYLCSDAASFINAENIRIDGGMTRNMIYHGDCGWSLESL